MCYYVNFNRTTVILPIFLRDILGSSIDIGMCNFSLCQHNCFRMNFNELHPNMPIHFIFNRYFVLCLHGNAGCILYECNKYFGWNQWAWGGSIINHCHFNHCLQFDWNYARPQQPTRAWIFIKHRCTILCNISCTLDVESVRKILVWRKFFLFLSFQIKLTFSWSDMMFDCVYYLCVVDFRR